MRDLDEQPLPPTTTIQILEETEAILLKTLEGAQVMTGKLGAEKPESKGDAQSIRAGLPALAGRLRRLACKLQDEIDGHHNALGYFSENKTAGQQLGAAVSR